MKWLNANSLAQDTGKESDEFILLHLLNSPEFTQYIQLSFPITHKTEQATPDAQATLALLLDYHQSQLDLLEYP